MNPAAAHPSDHPATDPGASPSPKEGGCPIQFVLAPLRTQNPIARIAAFLYGVFAYAVFFGAFLYAIGFVTGLFVPKTVSPGTAGPLLPAILINSALLGAFAVQHTIMARKWFKRWITRYVPAAIERSTFVLAASLILAAAFAFWQPMPQILWSSPHPLLSAAITAVSLLGFGTVLYASFLINHFDLFGLRQVFVHVLGREYAPIHFRLTSLYRIVRHPLMLGFLIAVWPTPQMTAGHLLFAVMITGYILVGVAIEERDLIADFGSEYLDYKSKVRGLLPLPVRKGASR